MTFNSKRNQKEFKIKWKARQIKIAIDILVRERRQRVYENRVESRKITFGKLVQKVLRRRAELTVLETEFLKI